MPPETPSPELPTPLARELFANLCDMLPPPASDTPEARARRDELAMTAATALHPADAFEAKLAARIVAMDAHAADSLRLAGLCGDDTPEMHRCRAQAISMARQADAALRALQRMQALRDKQIAEMHPAAMERAGYWFHDCSVPAPEPVEAPPPPDDDEEPERTPEQIDHEVKMYRVIYPDRAAAIVAAGGFTPAMKFGPPDPYIIAGLLRESRAT